VMMVIYDYLITLQGKLAACAVPQLDLVSTSSELVDRPT